jgi:AcrR family transcriptional regulator
VTVDDVVAAAGAANGTFYVHFDNVADLQSIVAGEFDKLLQPRRLALDDPLEPIAAGCTAFIAQTLRNTAWARWSFTAPLPCPASPAWRASD